METVYRRKPKHPFAQGLGFYKLFWVFFLGCVIGVIVETMWCLATKFYVENRSGVIYGPFNPVYGFGAYIRRFIMDYQSLKAEVEQKTLQTLEVLKGEFAGLRTGRASVHLFDGVRVPVYGSDMPINQVATVATPDNQTLTVTVWDINNAGAVEKAIRDSGLGLNPMTAGGVIRLNMPPLTEERRKELTKVSGKYAEEAKISMRNIRQDAMSKIKRAVTDKEISEDDQRKFGDDLQKVFDRRADEVDALAKQKEADIMSV